MRPRISSCVSAGGLGIGLILGYLVSSVFLARVDDPLIETSTTLALAYGSFLLAEEFGVIVGRDLHFSGILAVVTAGLMVGNVGMSNTSPSTRLTLEHFWELLTFLVNSMVFLVIGLAISLDELAEHFVAFVVAIIGRTGASLRPHPRAVDRVGLDATESPDTEGLPSRHGVGRAAGGHFARSRPDPR